MQKSGPIFSEGEREEGGDKGERERRHRRERRRDSEREKEGEREEGKLVNTTHTLIHKIDSMTKLNF